MSRDHSAAALTMTAILLMSGRLLSAAPKQKTIQITPLAAVRLLSQRGQYKNVKRVAFVDLWKDIRKPETLHYLVTALDKLKETEQAATFCHILLRVLDESEGTSARRHAALRKWAQAQLVRLDVAHRKARQEYLASAAGKRFQGPQTVSDLWMTQVQCDLHCLHGLYAWKLVGGRKDAKPDWIHNRQGTMHCSGMKHVEQVDGRKGVLYSVPVKAKTSQDADRFHRAILDRLGHPTRITTRNPGKCRFLRVGAKAYGFPFILKVYVSGKEVFRRRIGTEAWADLKVDLGDAADKDEPVFVELVVPEGQKWSEGVWIDYLDFFDEAPPASLTKPAPSGRRGG